MYYDKESGEIKVKEREKQKEKKILKNLDELENEKKALMKEIGLEEDADKNLGGNANEEDYMGKMRLLQKRMVEDYDLDPTQFYVFSRDFMRVDLGLMIQRPPIFVHMMQRDVDFLKLRYNVMNEYWCNQKQFVDEYEEVAKLNEDVLHDNPYTSMKNIDNYPTHRIQDEQTGEIMEYCGATKNFAKVDPFIEDRKNFHYAGEDKVYLILQNKYTKEWEFPTGKMFFGQTFLRAKQNMFRGFADGDWKVRYFG